MSQFRPYSLHLEKGASLIKLQRILCEPAYLKTFLAYNLIKFLSDSALSKANLVFLIYFAIR